ncbi:cupin domain-containing protein [Nocardioides sp.]|uniref:cupin domain-containing protein n=1 Tax=Nocardioides sp. TaxID=35761 RepID=UPI002ED134FB
MNAAAPGLIVHPGEGRATWHLDALWTWKIPAAATGGALSVAEQLLPRGSAPPLHRHTREDEAWIVLDGEVSFFVDGQEHLTGAGTYIFGPRERAHTYVVRSETARMVILLLPGACEEFFLSTGHAAASRTLPPPSQPDMEALMAGMARFGIEMVGPPPEL